MLRVSANLTPDAHMMSFPSIGTIETPDRRRPQTSFIVPGMIFTMVPGPDLAEEWVRQGCLIRGTGHPVFVLNTDELFFRETVTLALTATAFPKDHRRGARAVAGRSSGPIVTDGRLERGALLPPPLGGQYAQRRIARNWHSVARLVDAARLFWRNSTRRNSTNPLLG
jgi:hypothetical protein